MSDIKHIRHQLRQKRRALPAERQRSCSKKVSIHLQNIPEFSKAEHIAAYLASDGEVDLTAVFSAARNTHHFYLPRVLDNFQMTFHHYQQHNILVNNRYGLLEPEPSAAARDLATMDIVLMPLVGFDKTGNRLGMGGGYYDRALADLEGNKPLLIGIAHSFQRTTLPPPAHWDIPLHAVVTELGFTRF